MISPGQKITEKYINCSPNKVCTTIWSLYNSMGQLLMTYKYVERKRRKKVGEPIIHQQSESKAVSTWGRPVLNRL